MNRCILMLVLLAVAVCAFLPVGVLADENERAPVLSPAFDVLASDCRMIKCGLVSGSVGFTLSDFRQGMGLYEVDTVTFSRVPDPSEGYLAVGSLTVGEGQTVYGEMLDMLEFVPASEEVDIATFCFYGDSGTSGADIECTVRLIDRVNYAPTVAEVHENRLNITALSGKARAEPCSHQIPRGTTCAMR